MRTYGIFWLVGMALIQAQPIEWQSLGSERWQSMSGLARLGESFYVVHDTKRPGEAKVGQITLGRKGIRYTPVVWTGIRSPVDLEACALVPGTRQLALLESWGTLRMVRILPDHRVRVVDRRTILRTSPEENLEGLAFIRRGEQRWILWADRGSDNRPGKIYWAPFPAGQDTIIATGSIPVQAPWSAPNLRSISDLLVRDHRVYVSSVLDPGDAGPFSTRIYQVGTVQFRAGTLQLTGLPEPADVFRIDGHKVEGLWGDATGFWLATDDENSGGALGYVPYRERGRP